MRSATSTMTVRIDRKTRERVERLARATSRSRSFVAAEALRTYLDQNEWQVHAVREGIADADAGRLIAHERVESWLRTWGQRDEKAPPPWK